MDFLGWNHIKCQILFELSDTFWDNGINMGKMKMHFQEDGIIFDIFELEWRKNKRELYWFEVRTTLFEYSF